MKQYDDWYSGRLWVVCHIWYCDDGPGQVGKPLSESPRHCTKCTIGTLAGDGWSVRFGTVVRAWAGWYTAQ